MDAVFCSLFKYRNHLWVFFTEKKCTFLGLEVSEMQSVGMFCMRKLVRSRSCTVPEKTCTKLL